MSHHLPAAGARCLNCGTPLDGPYCAQCGQKAAEPKPSLHELTHDALEEFLHFDGKIIQTLRTLVSRPGQLTVDVLAGRRTRYVAPLRLYLTLSLLFFLLAAISPKPPAITVSDKSKPAGVTFSTDPNARVGREATTAEKQKLLDAADTKGPAFLRPLVHRLVEDPAGLQRDVFAAWPKALFGLLPVFALIVAAFYHRRRFVEHLYFALHLHAFAFGALGLGSLVSMAHIPWVSAITGLAVLIWIPIYAHFAFHRVYRESHLLTLLKETGVGILYGCAMIPAIFIAALWAAAHPH